MAEYLAIKNWGKYQSAKKRNAAWIKDDTTKDLDEKYSDLTMSQRYMLDACCRLRGRLGKNITNDPLAICRATAVLPRDRHNATAAIQELIRRGFLLLTNQEHDIDKVPSERERETEKEREGEKKDAQALPPLALAQKVAGELSLRGPGIIPAIAGAVDALVKEGKSPNSAVEFLIAHGKDAQDRGETVNRFWFDDSKWRRKEDLNGNGKHIAQAGKCPNHPGSGSTVTGGCWGCYNESPEETLNRIRGKANAGRAGPISR